MASQLEIINQSLSQLGAEQISAAQLAALSVKQAVIADTFWTQVRVELLEAEDWPFARSYRQLTQVDGYDATDDAVTVTGITSANPAVVTAAGHGFVTGDYITFADVVGMTELNGLVYHVTYVGATSFQLTAVDTSTDKFTAYVSGGTCYKVDVFARWQNGYVYMLPSDCLVVLQLEDDEDEFEVRIHEDGNKYLYCNTQDAKIRYIRDEDTVTIWPARFTRLFAIRLALEMIPSLMGSGSKSQKKREELAGMYRWHEAKAVRTDWVESQKDPVEKCNFLDDRGYGQ